MRTITLAILLSCLTVPASADSMIRRRAESSGYRGMGSFESETLRRIQDVKAREEGSFKFTGAVLSRLSKKKGGVEIFRVDLDKRWSLDPKKKTYTESSISLPPREEKEAVDRNEPAEGNGEDSKPTHRIKKATFEVKKTSDKKELNGFETQRHEAIFTLEVEELATKAVSSYKMISDHWLTPWTKALRKARDEEAAFARAYLKKTGLSISPQEKAALGTAALQALTKAGGQELEKSLGGLQAKLAKLDGFAVRTETRWLAEAPKGAKPKEKVAVEEDDDNDVDVSNGVGGFLGGLAKSAAKKKMKKAVAERVEAGDGKPAFTATMEVLEVSDDALEQSSFEVPEGYKKKG